MRGDRAEISDFPLYLNTVAGGLDCRDQTIGGFSFVVKNLCCPSCRDNRITSLSAGEIWVSTLNSAIAFEMVWRRVSSSSNFFVSVGKQGRIGSGQRIQQLFNFCLHLCQLHLIGGQFRIDIFPLCRGVSESL